MMDRNQTDEENHFLVPEPNVVMTRGNPMIAAVKNVSRNQRFLIGLNQAYKLDSTKMRFGPLF